jgi:hypothetical protein
MMGKRVGWAQINTRRTQLNQHAIFLNETPTPFSNLFSFQNHTWRAFVSFYFLIPHIGFGEIEMFVVL